MKRFIFFATLMFVLTSCGNNLCKILPEVEVTPILLSDSLEMLPPLQMSDVKSHWVFATPGMKQSLLFLDKQTQKPQAWGRMDNGPDDFTSAALVRCKDGEIRLFDSNLRKCVDYRLQITDSVRLHRLHEYRWKSDSITLLNMHMMDNGLMVGFAGLGSKDMFVLLNGAMLQLKTFGTVPFDALPEKNNLQMYGWFASYGNKLFFASQPTRYIVCFDISEGGRIAKEWEHQLTEPLYDLERRKWKKENRNGFFDIAANDKYVFVAFSGKSVADDKKMTPHNILVFTHDGELVKNVRIRDTAVGKIAVSDDGRKIYMVGTDALMYCELADWGLSVSN